MTDRNPFLHDVVSDIPADPACELCGGWGCREDQGWLKTCECRYPSTQRLPDALDHVA
jgi:hypothetical protein